MWNVQWKLLIVETNTTEEWEHGEDPVVVLNVERQMPAERGSKQRESWHSVSGLLGATKEVPAGGRQASGSVDCMTLTTLMGAGADCVGEGRPTQQGDHVMLKGLKVAAMNGKSGMVLPPVAGVRDRHLIILDDGGRQLMVKPENLVNMDPRVGARVQLARDDAQGMTPVSVAACERQNDETDIPEPPTAFTPIACDLMDAATAFGKRVKGGRRMWARLVQELVNLCMVGCVEERTDLTVTCRRSLRLWTRWHLSLLQQWSIGVTHSML